MAHPVVERAARGDLPAWSEVGEKRRRHVERVAALLEDWAWAARLEDEDRTRWVAAGYLHDAAKDAEPGRLREVLDGRPEADFPEPLLHGPAAAALLAEDGVDDDELLLAVAYHTLGHPRLGHLGRALYAADFLEPGRELRNAWRADLRGRMPGELDAVVTDILRARIQHLLEGGRPVRPETLAFWNTMVMGKAWASASEL